MRKVGMSSFDEWLDKNHPGTVLRDGVELLDADLDDMKAAYNAGMERAADIAKNSSVFITPFEVSEAIRKEIEK